MVDRPATDAPFVPLLTTTDWNEEWKRLQSARHRADSSEFWDKRAATFRGASDSPNSYVRGFIDQLRLAPDETVFDMGCGNGALALPLAAMGHRVVAADFSRGMLDALVAAAAAQGVADRLEIHHMSWEDDWIADGVAPKSVDVAFASRSIATADLQDSLMRLDRVARRRVAVSLTTSLSPRIDERILIDLGIQAQLGRDLTYAFNILVAHDLHPSISYLENDRHDRYDRREDALGSLDRMRGDILAILPDSQRDAVGARFDEWVEANLVQDEDADGAFWRLRHPRRTKWAFLSWEPLS